MEDTTDCAICQEPILCGEKTAALDELAHADCAEIAFDNVDDRAEVFNRMRSQELRTWSR